MFGCRDIPFLMGVDRAKNVLCSSSIVMFFFISATAKFNAQPMAIEGALYYERPLPMGRFTDCAARR